MGRYVTCGDDIVWKYRLGAQPSEIYRIPEELSIGQHFFVNHEASPYSTEVTWKVVDPTQDDYDGDLLVLQQSEATVIQSHIENGTSDQFFREMLEAILSYMQSKPDIETFQFLGEF